MRDGGFTSVEVRGPVEAMSNAVPLSVTCEGEVPATGGTSPSDSENPGYESGAEDLTP